MKLLVQIEIEVSENMYDFEDKVQQNWFNEEVLKADQLHIHSNEIGDSVGNVLSVKIIPPTNK